MTRLLIVGATGVLGSAASKHFLQKGFDVKCLVRDASKASELKTAGATIVVGDLTNYASIKEACKEVDIIITSAHGMLGKGKNSSGKVDDAGHRNLIDAAVQGGVQHFIYTSVNGAAFNHPVDFFRTKYLVEQYLLKSGLNYTILRLPAFMEWHAHNLLGKSIVDKGKVTILGKGDNPTNFIAVDDVVKALDIIAGNNDYFKKIIPLAGPNNISRNEVASLYGKGLNKTPKVGHVPVGALNVLSKLIKPFHPGIARVMEFSAYGDKTDSTMDAKNSISQFGLQPTTIEEFISKKLNS